MSWKRLIFFSSAWKLMVKDASEFHCRVMASITIQGTLKQVWSVITEYESFNEWVFLMCARINSWRLICNVFCSSGSFQILNIVLWHLFKIPRWRGITSIHIETLSCALGVFLSQSYFNSGATKVLVVESHGYSGWVRNQRVAGAEDYFPYDWGWFGCLPWWMESSEWG